MIWVVLLIILALALGGIGLVIDALQFLLGLGLILLLIAMGIGFWLRGRLRSALDGDSRGNESRETGSP